MDKRPEIDDYPYRSHSCEMKTLVLFLVVDIPFILILIGVCLLHLLSLVVVSIADSLQSLINVG